MPPDAATQQLLDVLAAEGGPPLEEMTPTQAREVFAALAALQGDPAGPVSVVDREIAGVPCQVITPEGDPPAEGGWPVLVWIHGGGWVIGCAAESTVTAARLGVLAGCIVINVDYRLAPEHPYPAAPDDCVAVTRWVLEHASELGGDPARVAVGGDSAGGNLSAVVANEVPGLVFQLLVYPVTDLTMSMPSCDENGEGYLLTKAGMGWFIDHYLSGGGDAKHPRVSPFYADDEVLSAAPPALVITAELDPLRDEGEAYAERLQAAGVATTQVRYDGQIHAFFTLPAMLPVATTAVDHATTELRNAFNSD
jgi:acetyl esterase